MGEEEGREGLLQHYLNGQVTKHNRRILNTVSHS
jgi:hypothetical protein